MIVNLTPKEALLVRQALDGLVASDRKTTQELKALKRKFVQAQICEEEINVENRRPGIRNP